MLKKLSIKIISLTERDVKEIIHKNNLSVKDLDLIIKISGGSIEIAKIIIDSENFNEIIEICKAISSFLDNEKTLDVDRIIQNRIKTDILLDIIINIYRLNLLTIIKKEKNIYSQLGDVFIDDEKKVLNLLKILIKIKKNESFNLNIKYAIKGLLYYLIKGYNDSLLYMGLIGREIEA